MGKSDQTYKVKYRLLHYYVDREDLLNGGTQKVEQLAYFGQTLHTAEGDNTETDLYGLTAKEIRRIEITHPGAFFSEAELDSEQTEPVESGAYKLEGEVVPIPFSGMAPWQLGEYLRGQKPTAQDVLDIINAEPDDTSREELAKKFSQANTDLGTDADEELVPLIAAVLGAGDGPVDNEADATDAAAKLAAENNVDLSEVTGTGTGNRITQPDVQKVIDARSQS
jgi:pyruvate/2-oxoglutarate dehydrogenase complex dihydrolipoamide acyltransferase (E2) component